MKKVLSMALTLILCLILVGCGNNNNKSSSNNDSSNNNSSENGNSNNSSNGTNTGSKYDKFYGIWISESGKYKLDVTVGTSKCELINLETNEVIDQTNTKPGQNNIRCGGYDLEVDSKGKLTTDWYIVENEIFIKE